MESKEADALRQSEAEYSQVGSSQCAIDLEVANRALEKAKNRVERLAARIHLTERQIDFFMQEARWALEGITAASASMTPEFSRYFAHLSTPPSDFSEVSDKFMLLLGQRDRSWNAFKVFTIQALVSDYDQLKAAISTVNADKLKEEQLTELLPIWKRHQSGKMALTSGTVDGGVMLQFLSFCVEYKLKSEILSSACRKLPILQEKLLKQQAEIETLKSDAQQRQKELKKMQHVLLWQDPSELDEKLSADLTGLTSLDLSKAVVIEERTIGISHLRHGTASGGLMGMVHSPKQSLGKGSWPIGDVSFPDFEREDLYRDKLQTLSDEEEFGVELEDEHELARCCGSKFFCM